MSLIYLDNNATTPIDSQVRDAMQRCYRTCHANPASQHQLGHQARRTLEDARKSIASTLGANMRPAAADDLLFTSGATESNNLALLGMAGSQPGKIVISAIEHPSLVGPAEHLQRAGWDLRQVSVDTRGILDLKHAATLITSDTRLVSIMLGNHETGSLQPVREISFLCRAAGVPFHTDATQVIGKLPVDFQELQVDALSFSAHKFHGPAGIGGLLLKDKTSLRPQLHGGFQQSGYRPGSEPVALAVGMQVALETWARRQSEHAKELADMRDRFENLLENRLPWISFIGRDGPRLPGTSSIAFPGFDRQSLMMALDQAGLACSTGSACASGSTDPSPVLQAMGLDETLIEGALRFSFGRQNQHSDSHQAVDLIGTVVSRLRGANPSGKIVPTPPQQPAKRL